MDHVRCSKTNIVTYNNCNQNQESSNNHNLVITATWSTFYLFELLINIYNNNKFKLDHRENYWIQLFIDIEKE